MNRFIYNLIILYILIIGLITIYDLFSENGYREPFIPRKVKEIYRPFHRNIRMSYEGFYNKSSNHISNLFRKFGIL